MKTIMLLWVACLLACSDDTAGVNAATDATGDNTGTTPGTHTDLDVGSTTADTDLSDLPFTVNDAGQVLCGDVPCECSDDIDDDGDGTVDGFDIECTGPYDNDEDSFATGIPGDNKDPVWQDCFFDGNSGSGNDGCRYQTGCLTGELPQSDPDCALSQSCIDFCAQYAPNGCDCFGCCEVYAEGDSPIYVQIGNSCSDDRFDDLQACPRCVQSNQCKNACGECELCGGKTVADLPASCFQQQPDMGTDGGVDMGSGSDMGGGTGGPGYTCDNGEQVCSAQTPCARSDEYCAQGCCIRIIL